MISRYVFSLLLAGLAWQPAYAAPLYKWVDSRGHVTYSSFPPPSGAKAENVKVPPQPTAEEILQAKERVKRMEEQASELEDTRRKQEAEEARLREAQQPQPPVVIEKPVYVREPVYYYPPPHRPRPHPPVKPPPKPRPN